MNYEFFIAVIIRRSMLLILLLIFKYCIFDASRKLGLLFVALFSLMRRVSALWALNIF